MLCMRKHQSQISLPLLTPWPLATVGGQQLSSSGSVTIMSSLAKPQHQYCPPFPSTTAFYAVRAVRWRQPFVLTWALTPLWLIPMKGEGKYVPLLSQILCRGSIGGVKVELHTFLTSALVGDEGSASRLVCFTQEGSLGRRCSNRPMRLEFVIDSVVSLLLLHFVWESYSW
jgi:hypothetical protein